MSYKDSNTPQSFAVAQMTAKLQIAETTLKACRLALQAAELDFKTTQTSLQELKSKECDFCDKGICVWPGGYLYHCPKCFVFGINPSADKCFAEPSYRILVEQVRSGKIKTHKELMTMT